MNIKKIALRKNLILIIVSMFLVFLGMFSDKLNNNYLIIFSFIIAIVISLFTTSDNRFYLLCILLPANRILTLGNISVLSLVIICDCFIRLLKNELKVTKNFALLSILLTTLMMIFSGGDLSTILSLIKIFLMLIFFYNVFLDYDINKIYNNAIDYISIGLIFTYIFSIIINKDFLLETQRFSLTNGGGENVLGIICAITVIHNISTIIKSKINKIKIFEIISIVFIGITTGSRSFLLALFIGLFIVLFIELRKEKMDKRIKYYASIIFLIFIIFILIREIPILNNFYNYMMYRINKLSNNDVSNGRFELWNQYITVFKNDYKILFFGTTNYSRYGINFVAHNMILEQVATYGIVGSFIIFFQYLDIFKSILIKKNMKFNLFKNNMAPIVSFIIVSMVSHSLFGIPQTLLLFLSLIICCNLNEKGSGVK